MLNLTNCGLEQPSDRAQLYKALLSTMLSWVSEDGVGDASLTLRQKIRLSYHYLEAMRACGFPTTAAPVSQVYDWVKRIANATLSPGEGDPPINLEVLDTLLLMGERESEYCRQSIDYILRHRESATRYNLFPEDARYFDALWCSKLLLYYPECSQCINAAQSTIETFVRDHHVLMQTMRDLSFLISLFIKIHPQAPIRSAPFSLMLGELSQHQMHGLFDVNNIDESTLKAVSQQGISSYNSVNYESALHWSLVSTSYVVYNLAPLLSRSRKCLRIIENSVAALYRALFPDELKDHAVYSESYRQIMLASRATVAMASVTRDDISAMLLPDLLENMAKQERNRQANEKTRVKRQLQATLKNWLKIDWDEKDDEALGGGYSGAQIRRVRPKLVIPSESLQDAARYDIPGLGSVIFKYGPKDRLDRERQNYASIPSDFRNFVAAIPAEVDREIVDGDLFEYLIIEDLNHYFTMQEALSSWPSESRLALTEKVQNVLERFYHMPPVPPSVANVVRSWYVTPMLKLLDTIIDFKSRVGALTDDDIQATQHLQVITAHSEEIGRFDRTVMHGDLNARNILGHGKPVPGADIRIKFIDLDKFSRSGDYAYDIGELVVDLAQLARRIKLTRGEEEEILARLIDPFEAFSKARGDATYTLRFDLAKARSILKLAEILARSNLRIHDSHPSTPQRMAKISEQLRPLLIEAYDLIGRVARQC